jgi:hypothetical protein
MKRLVWPPGHVNYGHINPRDSDQTVFRKKKIDPDSPQPRDRDRDRDRKDRQKQYDSTKIFFDVSKITINDLKVFANGGLYKN